MLEGPTNSADFGVGHSEKKVTTVEGNTSWGSLHGSTGPALHASGVFFVDGLLGHAQRLSDLDPVPSLIHRSLNGGGLEPGREPTKRHDRGERFGRVAGVWHLR